MARWEYFREGTTIREAGVKIVERLVSDPHDRQRTKYQVRCLACNRKYLVSHRAIERRVARLVAGRTRRCASCSKKGKTPRQPSPPPRPYGVTLPLWPRPPMMPAGRREWLR